MKGEVSVFCAIFGYLDPLFQIFRCNCLIICGLCKEYVKRASSYQSIRKKKGSLIFQHSRLIRPICSVATMSWNCPKSEQVALHIGIINIIINITRPKPAYSRQGLDWIVGPGYSFVVFSTNKTMETHQKKRKTMKPP